MSSSKVVSCVSIVLAVLGAVLPNIVSADPINITNASFETPALADGTDSDTVGGWASVTGWSLGSYGGPTWSWTGAWNPIADHYNQDSQGNVQGGEGKNVGDLYLRDAAEAGTYVTVYTTLTDVLKVGTYSLTVATGIEKTSSPANWAIRFGTISGMLAEKSGNGSSLSVGYLDDKSVSLTIANNNTHLGESLVIELYAISNTPSTIQSAQFDNVRLTYSSVPEPGTIVLLVTGLLGLLAYAWRKRK